MLKYILIFLLYSWVVDAGIPSPIHAPHLKAYAEKHLPQEGVLKQTEEGFLYVELPKEYVFDLLPLLSIEGAIPPPYFENGKVGAHITVASSEETAQAGLSKIPCLGQKVSFSILYPSRIYLEKSGLGSNVEVYMLELKSPQLEEIRSSLGLARKELGFHITIGLKRQLVPAIKPVVQAF